MHRCRSNRRRSLFILFSRRTTVSIFETLDHPPGNCSILATDGDVHSSQSGIIIDQARRGIYAATDFISWWRSL
jgi:hypothetical protein